MKYPVKLLLLRNLNSEMLQYYTVCNANGVGCGWKESERHKNLGDCFVAACPRCGCDNVKDESGAV